MEVFFEVAFASSLNLYIIDWDTSFPSEQYSNILSLAFFITAVVVTLYLIYFYIKNLGSAKDESFEGRYGAGLDGTKLGKVHDRWSIVVYFVVFLIRRIAFVASVIFLGYFLWAQLVI